MVSSISKKYTKAFIVSQSSAELQGSYEALSNIAVALKISKFQDILGSREVSNEQKSSFLIEISGSKNAKFISFVALLLKSKRVDIIPAVAEGIREFLSAKSGKARGVALASFGVGSAELSEISKTLSLKLQREIELSFRKVDANLFSGIKVEIGDLGVEVEINKNALQKSVITHILNTNKIF